MLCATKVKQNLYLRSSLNLSLINYIKHNKECYIHTYIKLLSLPKHWGQKKTKYLKLNVLRTRIMKDKKLDDIIKPLRAAVKLQGDIVRNLKEQNAPELDIQKAVMELKNRKKMLEDKELELQTSEDCFDRVRLENLLQRRFFYDQAFAIYGGISGQFDFGPVGCAIKSNILNEWRNHFILKEQMLEIDSSILTPEPVLKASGHVDRFADLMVKDVKTGECFRLDHLIKSHLEKLICDKHVSPENKNCYENIIVKLDGMDKNEMNEILQKFKIKSPITGNNLSEPLAYNLMFSTTIGPSGFIKGYLRPETAQGIFVNFKRLLDFNQGHLPFAVAQIGSAFRNEISPRSGLIRVREFTLAEIEYFCDPLEKCHSKFESVRDYRMLFYSACNQMDGKSPEILTIGEAVDSKLVNNETLGYFLVRIHQFLLKIGIDSTKLRFRQHMSNEMAHYASDCWDAECRTSYGWIECVGCADRSAYDLTQHMKATGIDLVAKKKLSKPEEIEMLEIIPNKAQLGLIFKKNSKQIITALTSLSEDEKLQLKIKLEEEREIEIAVEGNLYKLASDMISIKKIVKTIHVREIIPNVIEPSFGIGRIMYCLFEHSFKIREEDEQRTYLSLPPLIAPLKCSVLPLSGLKEFKPFVNKISEDLTNANLSHKVDVSSGSIGKRYSRTDEIAIPFGITIDFDTFNKPHSVTLRERNSMQQIRVPMDEVAEIIKNLSNEKKTWYDMQCLYPKFVQQECQS